MSYPLQPSLAVLGPGSDPETVLDQKVRLSEAVTGTNAEIEGAGTTVAEEAHNVETVHPENGNIAKDTGVPGIVAGNAEVDGLGNENAETKGADNANHETRNAEVDRLENENTEIKDADNASHGTRNAEVDRSENENAEIKDTDNANQETRNAEVDCLENENAEIKGTYSANQEISNVGGLENENTETKGTGNANKEVSNVEVGGSENEKTGIKDTGNANQRTSNAKVDGLENENAEINGTDNANQETSNVKAWDIAVNQLRNEDIRQPEAKHREIGGVKGGNTEPPERQEVGNVVAGEQQAREIIIVEDNGECEEGDGESEESDGDNEEGDETMDPSEVAEELQTCLEVIEDKGAFATCGSLPNAPNPVLSVEGIGIVGLPLSIRDAAAIIAAAAQAPFGHGERTVIDTNVRDTWELQPNQVQFLNPVWQTWIEKEVLAKAANELGVINAVDTVKCELYKVLLYKESGHFLPHKDTEKTPRMFGTLMVVLPSQYNGGVLHLSHGGKEKKFDFGGLASITSTSYAAWYTDILHSVSPVTSGYRFVLSYNLIHKGSTAPPHLPDTEKQIEDLRFVLSTWHRNCANDQSPPMLGWMLDHQYSEQALKSQKIEALKGIDKHRGKVLLDLAKEKGFEFYLAQMEYQKTGTVGSTYRYGQSSYGYDRWGYEEYENESDPEDKSIDEVIEESLKAHTFINCKNGVVLPADFKPSFDKKDCLPSDYWDEVDPDSKNYEPYMGNAEATLDYWYHRTAIIIWPTETHIDSVGHLTYGLKKVAFLDRALWTQEDIQGGLRLKFGERVIEGLSRPNYGLSASENEYAEKLMAFALEEKRLDLFLKMVEVTKSTNTAGMRETASVFGAEGSRDVVQRCIANIHGIETQLRMANQLYHDRPEDLKIVVRGLVDAVSITKEVEPGGVQGLLGLTGPELFQDCILPNIEKDFSKTSFWMSVWQHYPVAELIHRTLPEVVRAHEIQFHHTPDRTRYTISSQTLPLFSKVVEMVRADLAAQMIQKIEVMPKPTDSESGILKGKYPDVLMAITGKIIDILRKHKVPVAIEPYANFIKRTFLEKILPTLGPRPRPGDNSRLPTMREQGWPPCCLNCNAVDTFFSDPLQQTISFNLMHPVREHLQQKLQGRGNISIRNNPLLSQMGRRKSVLQGTITFTKQGLSTADVINQWDKRRATMEREFIAIGDEQTRRDIFGASFPMVYMGIREYGVGWGKEMEEAAIMGQKEEEEMRQQRLQSRARVIAGAMDYHADADPSSGGGGSDDVNKGVGVRVTNTGRKRKRSLQVIDLTNE